MSSDFPILGRRACCGELFLARTLSLSLFGVNSFMNSIGDLFCLSFSVYVFMYIIISTPMQSSLELLDFQSS